MIHAYKQFINWREEPNPGKPKPRKVPFSAATGDRIDPHDAGQWLTYEAAKATGYPVGFVFTVNDPFFLLDLDDCLHNGQWDNEAQAVCTMFAGAAIEVSQSGTGLHIVGSCDKSQLTERAHKFSSPARPNEKWLEFYVDGRFMALGHGFQGDFSVDGTAKLVSFVPRKERSTVDFTSGPAPEYTGPPDDAELIAKMLAARVSAAAAFGSKATVAQLWNGDVQALANAFPSPSGDAYDRSSADAALMSHLAFWTGKDAARMDRLFRQSKLMREKYGNRPEYQKSTVGNAIGGCRAVYSVPRALPAAPKSAPVEYSDEYLNITQMLHWFEGCVYVTSTHRIAMPNGDFLKPEQFNVVRGGKQFQMTGDGSKPTTSAFEAFTQNRVMNFPKARDLCFYPTEPPHAIIGEKLNAFIPDPQPIMAGDATPFLTLVRKLLPNPTDQQILLSWMAAQIQYPGVKFQWSIVLQGVEGNGKSFIWSALAAAIGQRYAHIPNSEDLANKFNSYIENKLLIGVEEIHMAGRREILDTLKPLITNNRVEVQSKGVDKRMIDNVANWFFLTNHRDAIIKTWNDRRYAIFFTAQQHEEDLTRDGMNGQFFPDLYNWARHANGYAIIHHFLKHYQIADEYNPAGSCQRAPLTSTTSIAVDESKGRAEQEIENAIANDEPGFRGGWISSFRLEVLLREHGVKVTRSRQKAIVESLGFREVARATRSIISEDNKRPVLFAHKSVHRRDMTQDEYETAQRYVVAQTFGNVVGFPTG